MFQVVSNIYQRGVVTSMTVEEYINSMKNPDFVRKSQVNLARSIYKNSAEKKNDLQYKNIKNSLPCITFLNTFNDYVSSDNLVSSTGYMYLDVDDISEINLSRYNFVVSYWKSLSNNGYGILIKYKKDNSIILQDCVKELSTIFNLKLDTNAVSIDRLNVMGYDTDIYYNPNYTEYSFNTNLEEVSNSYIIKSLNRLEAIDTDSGIEGNLRYSNLQELEDSYNYEGKKYLVLEDKIAYAEIFIPKNIFEGNRNKSMFVICSQIRGLNVWISREQLYRLCNAINKDKFKPLLQAFELNQIVDKVFEKEVPVIMLNKTRRIVYNKDFKLTVEEKRAIAGEVVGKGISIATDKVIAETLKKWDVIVDGKPTYKRIAEKSKLGIATVKRRSKSLKIEFEKLNKKYLEYKK